MLVTASAAQSPGLNVPCLFLTTDDLQTRCHASRRAEGALEHCKKLENTRDPAQSFRLGRL